jgi:hypothetical protein
MERSFTMTRAEVVTADPATLKVSIMAATGSESGANSILRSLERMGTDPTIEYFEMTEVTATRRFGGTGPAGWRVRADRGLPDPVEEPTL